MSVLKKWHWEEKSLVENSIRKRYSGILNPGSLHKEVLGVHIAKVYCEE